jgi:hypothetical protein
MAAELTVTVSRSVYSWLDFMIETLGSRRERKMHDGSVFRSISLRALFYPIGSPQASDGLCVQVSQLVKGLMKPVGAQIDFLYPQMGAITASRQISSDDEELFGGKLYITSIYARHISVENVRISR